MSWSWIVPIEISEERIKDILITAIESPPGEHWCKLTGYCQHDDMDLYDSFFKKSSGWMQFSELDDNGDYSKDHKLCWFGETDSIHSGIKVMAMRYPDHFGDWLSGKDDAITAYVFLQCCLLGEVIYG